MRGTEQQRIAELEAENAALRSAVTTLLARIEDLEARLNQNSDNSSLPPSSNPPGAPKLTGKKPTGRKPGGQPRHKGHHRAEAIPDHVIDHHPAVCAHCDTPFTGIERESGDPIRHQVTEIPPVRLAVTEHRPHRLRCARCHRTTRAGWPQGVPSGHFGARIVALVVLLSGRYRITRREIPALLENGFGLKLSVGTVQALCEQSARALEGPYTDVAARVIAENSVHADETGWRHQGKKWWLWTVGTKQGAVFRLEQGRGHEARRTLLPDDYGGVIHTDCWAAYNKHERRQICHAHLLRNWRTIAEREDPAAAAVGNWGIAETERLLRLHRLYRAGTLSRSGLKLGMRLVKARYARLLNAAEDCGDKKAGTLARDGLWGHLWTFVHTDGVEPTNNEAERDLRPAVLWRKGSFGTWSQNGQRFVERSLTVAATARKLGRPLFGFLVDACHALHHRLPAPCLYAVKSPWPWVGSRTGAQLGLR